MSNNQPGAASTTRRAPRALKPVYPPKPQDGPHFWLAHLLRSQAAKEELLNAFANACKRHRYSDHPLVNGLSRAIQATEGEVEAAAEYTVESGQLPLAWQHTRHFAGAAA